MRERIGLINARVGRQAPELLDVIIGDKEKAPDSTIILNLGNNNKLTREQVVNIFEAIKNQPKIIVVNTAVPRGTGGTTIVDAELFFAELFFATFFVVLFALFFTADFFATLFFATAFLATRFLAVDFFATDFFATAFFFAGAFLEAFFTTLFVVDFFTATFTP